MASEDAAPKSSARFGHVLKTYALAIFQRFNLSEQHFLIGLAMLVGIGGGAGSIVFRELLEHLEHVLRIDTPELLPSVYLLPLIPAVGGLVAGVLVYLYAREAKGHGVPEVMNAIITKRGVIRRRVVVIKALASAFTLGSGGSAGSEGPIIQIGSAWGSSVGQMFRFSETHVKMLLACGAAAGISAIFNAPIAGVLFAMEIILGDFTIAVFTPIVISSVMSAVVAHAYWGDHPVFVVPDYRFVHPLELIWYLALAALSGGAGVLFIKALYASEDFFDDCVTWIPEWSKPAIGGLLVGCIGLIYPQVMGVGYKTIGDALTGVLTPTMLLVFFALKFVTTPLTLGSGGSGGVFAPALFFGATLGGAFGQLAQAFFPNMVSQPGAYALVGMSAMVAATTHAPLTAMLIIVEMTGSYHIMLPLMLATILAVVVARALERESIYTLKLVRRGLRAYQGRDLSVLEKIPVSQIMRTDFDFVREHTPLGEIVELIQHGNLHDFPVLDHAGHFMGMIWFHDIREVMLENDMYALLIAEDVLGEQPPQLLARSSLAEALMQFISSDTDALPIFVSAADKKLAGVITRTDLMRCYERELLLRERSTTAA